MCTGCTFEECKEHAVKSNSKGFAYGGDKLNCRVCDDSAFQNLQTTKQAWGLYVKSGNLTIVFDKFLLLHLKYKNRI